MKNKPVIRKNTTLDKITFVAEIIGAICVLVTRPYFLKKGEREV